MFKGKTDIRRQNAIRKFIEKTNGNFLLQTLNDGQTIILTSE